MWVWSAVLLAIALGAYIGSLKCIGDKPAPNMKYVAFIFGALLTLSILCMALTWKYACPAPDRWLNIDCFRLAGLFR